MYTVVLLSEQPIHNTVLCFPLRIHFLPKHINTTDTLHVEAPSELLELQHSSSIAHITQKNLGADSKKKAKRLGHSRDRYRATSLLGQEFCEGNMKAFVKLTALPFSSPHRF